jgi:hypothetical protein
MLRALAFVLLLTASCGGRSALDDWPTATSSAHDARATTPADASKPGRDATLPPVDAGKHASQPDAAVDAMARGGSPRPEDAGGDAIPDASVISLDAAGELDAATPVDDAGSCASPVITFQLTARPGSTWFISGSDNSDTPGSTWLTLFLPSGVQLFTSAGETLSLDCRSCSGMFPYGFGYWMSELPDAGVTGTWNGFAYVAGACGSSGTACLTPLCMPRGPYLAKMCATHEAAAAAPACVDVPFEYPTTQTITGMLP